MQKGPKRSLQDQTFHQLTVVGYAGVSPRGVHLWHCRCTCGKPKVASTSCLEHGQTKSCGCLRKQPRIRNGFASTDGLARQLRGHYRQSAERRNISFTLTEEEFKKLVEQNCFYCGQEPNREYRPTRYKSSFRSNGVDRVDNSIGYETSNCVPCCRECNRFKSDMTQEKMFEIVRKIYTLHLAGQEEKK
jgi:hypothetical protein